MRKAGAVKGPGLSRLIFNIFRKPASLCAGLMLSLPLLATAATLPTATQLSATSGDSGRTTFHIKVNAGEQGIDGSVPSGAVTLSNGRSSLGSVLLDENGEATYTAASPSTQQVTAVYEGDESFTASSSLNLTVPAASTVPGFSLSATPTTLSVKTGAYVASTVTITPANGFDGSVLLSCSGLPANSTCAFNPTNVVPGGTAPNTTPASSILTIQTVAASNSSALSPGGQPGRAPLYAVAVPGLAALAGLGLLRKRALRPLGMAALLIGCALGLSACSPRYSYFHHPPLTNPGTTTGTFTVLVNGSSANAGSVLIPTPVSIVLTVTK